MVISVVAAFFDCPKDKVKVKIRIPQAVNLEMRRLDGKFVKMKALVGASTKWLLYPNGIIGVPCFVRSTSGTLIERVSVELDIKSIIKKQKFEKINEILEDSPWNEEEKKLFVESCTQFGYETGGKAD